MFVNPLDAVKLGLVYRCGDNGRVIKTLPKRLKKIAKSLEGKGKGMKSLRERNADCMNLVVSYGVAEDKILESQGYKFLGAGKDGRGEEVHVFQKEPLSMFKKRMKEIEESSKKSHPDLMK